MLLATLSGLGLIAAAVSRSQATITIQNPSFEANFADGSNLGSGGTGNAGPADIVPSWTVDRDYVAVAQPNASQFPQGVLNGNNVIEMNGGILHQDLGTMVAGDTYTFSVSYGWRLDIPQYESNQFAFILRPSISSANAYVVSESPNFTEPVPSGAVVSNNAPLPSQTGQLVTDTFSYTATSANNNQPLTLQLQNTDLQLLIDQVQLVTTVGNVDPNELFFTGAASGAFDSTSVDNFATSNGTAAQFVNGTSSATFNDIRVDNQAGVQNSNIVIQTGGVQPTAVNVASSTVNYTFTDNDGINGIFGPTGITKSGTSVLTLSGSNNFTGAVNVSAGTLAVGSNGALGASVGVTVLPGALLEVLPGISLPSNVPLLLEGTDTVGRTSQSLMFNQSSAASTTIAGGPILLLSNSSLGTTVGSVTLAGNISGIGALKITTGGPVILGGSSTYTGVTNIDTGDAVLTGSINAANNGGVGQLLMAQTDNTARLTVQGGTANFDSLSRDDIASEHGSYASIVLNSGTLNFNGGALSVSANTGAYAEFIANGGSATFALPLGVGYYGQGVATLNAGSVFNAQGYNGVVVGNSTQGTGTVNLNGGTLNATSVQLFNGSNISFNGGTLKASGNSQVFLSGSGATGYIYANGATVDDGGNTVVISQNLSAPTGTGVTAVPITTAGTGYSSAPIVQFTGGTLVPGGIAATGVATYSNGSVSSITITNPGNYLAGAGPTASFSGGGSGATAPVVGAITTAAFASGGLTKVGSGTLQLSGSNTYTGETTISAGTLQVGGAGAAVSIVNPNFTYHVPDNGLFEYSPPEPAGGWNYISDGGATKGAGVFISSGNAFNTNGAIPYSNEAAFIQKSGAIQETLNFPSTGTYTLSFYSEQRLNYTGQMFDVYLDDPNSGGQDLDPSGLTPQVTWEQESFTFSETAGSHLLTIGGLTTNDDTAYVADVTLNAAYTGGSVTNAIPDNSPVVVADGAVLDINNSLETIGSLSGTSQSRVTLGSGTLTIGGDGTSTTFSGTITDGGAGGSLVKIGSGTQTLNGISSYTGSTNVSGGTLVVATSGALPANTPVAIGRGAVLVLNSQTTASAISALNLNGSLIVHNGTLSTLNAAVAAGFNNGAFNGSKAGAITSSSANSDTAHLTALGVIQDSSTGSAGGSVLYSTFAGQTGLTSSDVIAKYTYFGDANLDGKVDATDYSRIDNGYVQHLTGWYNGDFNYDGVINGSDYTLIDNAFNTQGAAIQSAIASPLAEATAQVAGTGVTSAVPEPATLGLFGIGSVGLLRRRRRN